MAQSGVQGHRGSNGSTLTDRIDYRCEDFDGGAWAENIGSAFNLEGRNHALKTVLGLIIDDGVPSRGHRENIFSTDFEYIGIYSVVQGDYIKTVMNFHSEDLVVDNEDSDDEGENNQNIHPQPKPKPIPPAIKSSANTKLGRISATFIQSRRHGRPRTAPIPIL